MGATDTTPRTFQERWDAAPPAPGAPLERGDKIVLGLIVPVLIGIFVGAYVLMDRWINDPWGSAQWETRADTVATALNERYVEDFQVHRNRSRSGKHEVFVIDGKMREDCTVADDRRPVLTCVGPLRLHEER